MACTVMVDSVVACVVVACMVMAYIVMACVVMARRRMLSRDRQNLRTGTCCTSDVVGTTYWSSKNRDRQHIGHHGPGRQHIGHHGPGRQHTGCDGPGRHSLCRAPVCVHACMRACSSGGAVRCGAVRSTGLLPFFLISRSMPTANAEDPRRSEGTQRRVTPRPFFSDATPSIRSTPRRSPSACAEKV